MFETILFSLAAIVIICLIIGLVFILAIFGLAMIPILLIFVFGVVVLIVIIGVFGSILKVLYEITGLGWLFRKITRK